MDAFLTLFSSPGRSPEIPESEDLYGWLVGSWNLDVLRYDGEVTLTGEAHFGWALEGLAIADVWIMPRPVDRAGYADKRRNMYGTTLRIWDPTIRAWRIRWRNAVSGSRADQIAHRSGNDIVQIGARPDGTPTRWRFTDITSSTFHWLGEALAADGVTWQVEGEFRATRIG